MRLFCFDHCHGINFDQAKLIIDKFFKLTAKLNLISKTCSQEWLPGTDYSTVQAYHLKSIPDWKNPVARREEAI